jgi:AmmeMemoRadiSam system protein B/AmmeMemoRadiSam system protein A
LTGIVFYIHQPSDHLNGGFMGPIKKTIGMLAAGLSIVLILLNSPGFCSNCREPVVAGAFYPKDKDALIALIDDFTRQAQKAHIVLPADKHLNALIMPHAGYIYSGLAAAHASLALKGRHYKKVIIMGPDHRVGFSGGAISNVDAYATPLGKTPLHPDAAILRRQTLLFQSIGRSDDLEHCIEAELPFLQTYLDHFEIVPIVMGRGDLQPYAAAVESILDQDTLIVVSSDLSHYLPYKDAVHKDHETIRMILDLNMEGLSKRPDGACGIMPMLILMRIAARRNWEPMLICYNNSGDTAGDKNKVVGYATIAFYGDTPMKQENTSSELSKDKGEILLKLARKTIAQKLGIPGQESSGLENSLKDETFRSRRGTFVTLKINNQLRGCIGNLNPDKTILDGVQDNAVNAAFSDPRFRPLSKNEFDKIHIEVSLLTEPKQLEFKDATDLLAKLRPHIDGVIIRKGMYSATFLPQVWEQLPDKKEFLEHLCMKAGLPAGAWREPGLEVSTYQVQYFEENH